ncbi:MAG TPA: hypothetical protein VK174_17295, partial [Chitinophagales bacterium]|nr:hypothetical protein [Chitinophagales bacterium]
VTNNTGTSPYNYVWSNGGVNTQNQNGLAPGPIAVTVTDANGCTTSGSIVVGVSGNNTNAAFAYTGAPCGPNATINFAHTGSNSVSHYWDFGNGAGTSTLSAPAYTFAATGTYQVTHIVSRGFCLDSVKQTVTIFAKPVIASANTNVSCNGAGNGSINLSVTSGTSPYTYNWGGGINTEDRTGLAPGAYTVTVTDNTPCSASFTTTITQPAPLAVNYTSNTITCYGGANGTIALSVSGGSPAYSYNWGGGVTTSTRSGLTGGTYTVTVTDANLCSSVNNIIVYQPAPIAINTFINNAACNGQAAGAINVSVSGGTGAYSYDWGGGITTQNRAALAAGTYNLTVTDANTCSASAAAVVTEPEVLTATLLANNVSCFAGNNGSITTATTGGTSPYNYTWSDGNGGENRYTLPAADYTVTVLDANDCSATAAVTVGQPAAALTITANATNINCFGDSTGTINVRTAGGTVAYTYNWSDGSTQQNRANLQAGTYNVSVTDLYGCQASITRVVTQPAQALTIDSIVITNVSCYGNNTGALTTIVNGGTAPYTYNWGGGLTTPNRNNLVAGTYQLTVTDNKGCSASASATITQPAAALSATIAATNLSCANNASGSINLTVAGGTTAYSFNWGNGITTQNRTGLNAGTYTVTVTDANSCTVSNTATLTQPASLNIAIASTSNVLCFGANTGAINTTTTGGTLAYAYNWGDGAVAPNRTGLAAGNYAVTVTDANSCSASVAANIIQPASALNVLVASTTNVACFGGNTGAITISVTGGTTAYNYSWGNGITSQNRTGLTAGTYNVTVTDANLCSVTTTAAITQPAAALTATISSSSNISCAGGNNGSINVTVTGGTTAYTYNWGNG